MTPTSLSVESSSLILLEGSELATAVRKGREGGRRNEVSNILHHRGIGSVLTSSGGRRLAVL